MKTTLPDTSLTIAARTAGRLTRSQERFNKLTARIKKLEKELAKESARLERLFTEFTREVQPHLMEHARLMHSVAGLLDEFARKHPLKKPHLASIQAVIADLWSRSSRIVSPTPHQKEFYGRWLHWDADGGHTHAGNTEDENKRAYERRRQPAQKSKHQRAADADREAVDETKQRSLRSVYIALAKVLHPDTDTDMDGKRDKEELMKQVTQAYTGRDLTKLLRLEVEWVREESRHIDRLTDETIQTYVSALEDQMAELKRERAMLGNHSRYDAVSVLADFPEARAVAALHLEAETIKEAIVDLKQFRAILESPLPPAEILKHIRNR